MIKRYDIVGIGTNAIEQVTYLHRIPHADTKVVCLPQNYELFSSGSAGNTLTGLARLGIKTGYLGMFGGDSFGIMIKQACANEGIDLSHCELLPDESSSWNWSIVDEQGKRASILFPNILTKVDVPYIEMNAYYIRLSRLLHIETSGMLLSSALYATEIAKAEDVLVTFTLNAPIEDLIHQAHLGTKTELEELISYTDLFISCQEGARELTGKEEPLEMAAALREKYLIPNIVISSDSDGCFIATEKEIFHSPAFTIERVDTLGADDAFSAGIVFGFFKGWNIREIARFGNACKAMNSLKKGPRGGMTSEAEVREFIAQYVS